MIVVKGVIKFIPVIVLAAMMISGFDILVSAPAALVVAFIVAAITEKAKFKDSLNAAIDNVKEVVMAMFILLFAYAMANVFMATGVGASVVNIALALGVNARTVAVVALAVTAVLSVATGTSWGTFAACVPIFLWLNHIVEGDVVLTLAACAGGACFGDNIGLISDTTIVSSGIQGVEVIDRIRHQGVWSLLCLILAGIVTLGVATGQGLSMETVDASNVIGTLPENVWTVLEAERPVAVDLLRQVESTVPYYMIIPLVLVVGLAVWGCNTFVCIFSGIVAAYILGNLAGTVDSTMGFIELVVGGFADAGSWAIQVMMWVSAFGGVMASIHAFEPLSKLIVKISRSVKQLLFCNGIFCVIGNACLSDEMAQIVTCGPIIKGIVEENIDASEDEMYKLKLRNAALSDAMGVYGSQLIPWHCYMVFYVGIATAVYPLFDFDVMSIITHNYLAWIAVFSMLILTITGADKYIPLFRLPREPEAKLKKAS
ncbi:MAG TPA: Na+/H+ antiporter NhaC family protein [Anaerovoracaceae bacterium]|nr:Na+/H+ antiporter NhaC family protein [Anaerovoracaceae bacterium]